MFVSCVQASLEELVVNENDSQPARIILYSNLPIACQSKPKGDANATHCEIQFKINSSNDIAVRLSVTKALAKAASCAYQLENEDWKPDEGYAYDSNRSLDIVAKVIGYSCAADISHLH